ncbi:DUF4190 domain-containing protein [Natronosporangium hydrolyticum]|uniref:DUF4190 domain-containing protein n=1 Tax=Natronosporangium hydrolyticum TaxID=2811111 RepID=A0A895Y8M6_9ACTN|nr:DUF4190 domain-containing protein [Natronosporangium hydrolyticum]QSB14077.1 DUF4190 domain-containing protein [Natronosporangium hydrolyticum]
MTDPTPDPAGSTPEPAAADAPAAAPTEAPQPARATGAELTPATAAAPPPGHPPPGYDPAPGQPPPPYPYPYAVYPPPRPTSTMAILALVFGVVFAPVGIVLGHVARRQIRERGEDGDTLALVGLIIGYVQTGLLVLFCVGYAVFFVLFMGIMASSTW